MQPIKEYHLSARATKESQWERHSSDKTDPGERFRQLWQRSDHDWSRPARVCRRRSIYYFLLALSSCPEALATERSEFRAAILLPRPGRSYRRPQIQNGPAAAAPRR